MMDQKGAGTRGPGSGKVTGEVTWGNQAGHNLPVPGDTQASANSRCLKTPGMFKGHKGGGQEQAREGGDTSLATQAGSDGQPKHMSASPGPSPEDPDLVIWAWSRTSIHCCFSL